MSDEHDSDEKSRQELETEIASLRQQQSEALQAATFLGMTKEQSHAYDKRAARLSRLLLRLGLLA
jgi:hypothetical protein